jgi:hypothetical protein
MLQHKYFLVVVFVIYPALLLGFCDVIPVIDKVFSIDCIYQLSHGLNAGVSFDV